jgi:hypothetical protein
MQMEIKWFPHFSHLENGFDFPVDADLEDGSDYVG